MSFLQDIYGTLYLVLSAEFASLALRTTLLGFSGRDRMSEVCYTVP